MLPPMPACLVPVTAQQDIPKSLPDIAPVTPVQPSAHECDVMLDRDHPQETLDLLYAEQQRRQQQRQKRQEQVRPESEVDALDEYLEMKGDATHLGVWIDTQV